jgi:hypothetical protein
MLPFSISGMDTLRRVIKAIAEREAKPQTPAELKAAIADVEGGRALLDAPLASFLELPLGEVLDLLQAGQ